MKKIILLLAILFSPLTNVQGLDLQGRAACLFLQHKTFRDIYGTCVASFEFEASSPLVNFLLCPPECCELYNWTGWTNLSYYEKKGNSTYLKNCTHVTNWSVNFGFKRYFCGCQKIRPYLGFGIGASNVRFKDDSIYVRQELDIWGFSLLGKSGIEFEILSCLFLDLFADYASNWFEKPHSGCGRSTNSGGLKLGLGIGWRI